MNYGAYMIVATEHADDTLSILDTLNVYMYATVQVGSFAMFGSEPSESQVGGLELVAP